MDTQRVRIRQRLKVLILLLIFIAIIYGGYFLAMSIPFRITGTNPSTTKVTSITPFFNITFNKPLSSNNLSVTADPADTIVSYKVTGKTLQINLTGFLQTKVSYTITIKNISDTAGKQIKNKRFTFTPTLAKGALPPDQEKVLLNQQTQSAQNIQGDPLVQLLPFTGAASEYYIDYSVGNEKDGTPYPIITITAPTEEGTQDALTWIKNQGFDPNKYHIQYQTGAVSN